VLRAAGTVSLSADPPRLNLIRPVTMIVRPRPGTGTTIPLLALLIEAVTEGSGGGPTRGDWGSRGGGGGGGRGTCGARDRLSKSIQSENLRHDNLERGGEKDVMVWWRERGNESSVVLLKITKMASTKTVILEKHA
jgi:hypothetical protein